MLETEDEANSLDLFEGRGRMFLLSITPVRQENHHLAGGPVVGYR